MARRSVSLRVVAASLVSAIVASVVSAAPAAAQPGGVVISEIHYHAVSDLDTDDFLELANTSSSPVNISGWSFSAGITATIPAGTTLAPGAYYVLSSSASRFQTLYGFAPDAIYTGKLSNSGEAVTLVDTALAVVDTVTYADLPPWPATADGTGPSLELRGLLFDNTLPENWGASTISGGTPKAVNTLDGTAPPPQVQTITATPARPAPAQATVISARLPQGSTATLFYKVMFGAEIPLPFLDDAASPGGAGDGVYGVTVPGQTAGQLVRYRVAATDLSGASFSAPAVGDGANYLGYVVTNPAVISNLPVVEWFMEDAVYNDLLANHRYDDVQGAAVLAYNGVVYDNVKMNIRGDASRAATKVQFKVEMAAGHRFSFPALPYTVDSWAMNNEVYPTIDVAWRTVADGKARGLHETAIRTQRNGQFWSVSRFLELEDGTWRDQQGVKDWSIYKASGGGLRTFSSPAALQASLDLEKKSRTDEDFTDVWTLTQKLNQVPSNAQKQWLEENVNIPVMINYMAINAIMRHWDSGWKNWYVARDTLGTGRWEMWHWDIDNTFDATDTNNRGDYLVPERAQSFLIALMNYQDYRDMYFRRLRTLSDQLLVPGRYEAIWDSLTAPYKDNDWNLERAKWGGSTEPSARGRFVAGVDDRRALIAAYSGPGDVIPLAQSAAPSVVINEIMYAPSGNPDLEYVELTNPTAEAVDMSGWNLDGVGYTFQPGTVLLPGRRLVVVANDTAFRAAHPGSTSIAGQYSGRLDNAGETITLKQGVRVVDAVTYSPTTPWPDAAAGAGAALELLDPGLDNADPASWVAGIPGGTPGQLNGGTPPADVTAPSAVSALTATASAAGVLLTWGQATDDRGVTGYQITKDGNLIATVGLVGSFVDNVVAAGATYTYGIRAVDRAGNPGPGVTASVLTGPTLTTATETFTGANGAKWPSQWATTSADDVSTETIQTNAGALTVPDTSSAAARAILHYFDQTDTELLTSFQWQSGGPVARLSIFVRAGSTWTDAARPSNGYGVEITSNSTTVSLRRMAGGQLTTLGTVANGQVTTGAKQWLRLRAVGSTIQFRIWTDGAAEPTTWQSTVTDSVLTLPGDVYISNARVSTGAGSKTTLLDDVKVTTGVALTAPDHTAPSVPTGLAATGTTATSTVLTWTASTDNIGVSGYDVLRDAVVVGTTTTATTYTDTGLSTGVTYSYTVRARDGSGNVSANSTAVPVTTPVPDVEAPTAPANLAAVNVTQTTTGLTWTAATDNVAVVGYRVYRDGTLVGSPTGTSHTDTGLAAGSTYTYTVKAVDAAGNLSADSAPLPVTTSNQAPPLYTDTFTGTNGQSWGPAWTTAVRTGSVTLDSGAGLLSDQNVANSYARAQLTGVAPQADSEVLLSYLGAPPAGYYLTVYLKGSGGWNSGWNPINGYGLEIKNSTSVSYMKFVNGVNTKISVANAQVVSAAKHWLRLRVVGSTVQFRIWLDGQTEPAAWTGTYTDSAVTAPGQLFLGLVRSSTGTTAGSMRIDDVMLTTGNSVPLDTQAPTAPSGLASSGTTFTSTVLNWSPATDNVGVTGYNVYRDGVIVASPTGTGYTDNDLAAGSVYTYIVKAADAAGNLSGPSNAVTVTTPAPDIVDPTAPSDVVASGTTRTATTLSWTASTDDVAVTRYRVFRDGVQVGTPTTNTFTDSGLVQATTYSYTVDALDAAGNISDPSDPLPVTTLGPDVTPPSVPTGLAATGTTHTATTLTWTASTDDEAMAGYLVFRDGVQVATPTGTTFSDSGLTAGATYAYTVKAVDAAGNASAASAPLPVTTVPPDSTPPSVPTGLAATGTTRVATTISWTASTDDEAMGSYQVFRDGMQVGTPTGTSFADSGLTAGTTYVYTVAAVDAAGNASAASAPLPVTTLAPDVTPPSVPTGLVATGTTGTSTTISWSASTDDEAMAGYRVFRDGVQVGTPTSTSFPDSGLTGGVTYVYTVRAVDAAGNVSAPSAPLPVTTVAGPVPLYTDDFTGTNGTPWKSQWTTAVRSGTATIDANTGLFAAQDVTSSYARAQLTGVAPRLDSELLMSYQGTPPTNHYLNVYLRGSGGWSGGWNPLTGYGLEIKNSTTVSYMKYVNGVVTKTPVANAQVVSSAKHWLRLRVVGSTIQFKIWLDGQAEPTAWTATFTDTAVTTPGQTFVSLTRSSTAGSGSSSLRIDDLQLLPGA